MYKQRLFAMGVALVAVLWGCSSDPPSIGVSTIETNTRADTENETAVQTDGQSVATDAEAEDTGSAPATVTTDDDTRTPEDSETVSTEVPVDPGDCPWTCVPLIGPAACDQIGDKDAVHNPNFQCGDPGYACCQPPGAKSGLKKDCAAGEAMWCQKSCGEGLVETTDFYCNDATRVCCMDPDGPPPTCEQAGGYCETFLFGCDKGFVESDLECGFGEKCCQPPACPWECKELTGPAVCSEGKEPPKAVRNYNYSCERRGDVCCEPFEETGAAADSCHETPNADCAAECRSYERQRTDLWCKASNTKCCEDTRSVCADISGRCETIIFGCDDGWQPSEKGKCGSSLEVCCTKIPANNTCALQGGRCVEVGSNCPLGYLPEPLTSCGSFDMCCKPIIDI